MELDEDVNFSKLDKELEIAIKADERYQRENMAKFRAVEQRVATYEEFRDIVLASHIMPLERKDKFCDGQPVQKCWNTLSQRTSEAKSNGITPYSPSCENKHKLAKDTLHVALSGAVFNQIWKNLDGKSEKYNFLKKYRSQDLMSFFGVDAGEAPLGEIFCILDTEFRTEDFESVSEIWSGLNQCSRFDLAVLFLNKEEKASMKCLVEKLHSINQGHLSNEVKEL